MHWLYLSDILSKWHRASQWSLVTPRGVIDVDHHWVRYRLDACVEPGHCLNQCCHIVNSHCSEQSRVKFEWIYNTFHSRKYFCRCTWWRHQMETFSALLAICVENSPVSGEFPAQRPVTRSFDVFFDLRLNKRLSKHPWGWWIETPSGPLWRHSNENAGHSVQRPQTGGPFKQHGSHYE